MTSEAHEVSPELIELLSDVGKQRENVLLSVTRNDVATLLERPNPGRIRKSFRSMSAAEREILDGRRHELAELLYAAGRYGVALDRTSFRDVAVEDFPLGSEAELKARLADSWSRMFGSDASDLFSVGNLPFGRPLEQFAASVRLAPRPGAKIGLGYALRADGHESSAARCFRRILDDESNRPWGSYGAEGLALLAGDRTDPKASLRWWRAAANLDERRVNLLVGWAFESIREASQLDLQRIPASISRLSEWVSDEDLRQVEERRRCVARGEIVVTNEARSIAERQQDSELQIIREVASAFL